MSRIDLNPRDIELTLKSSRGTLELGEPWEILLHIVNYSDQGVWISALSTTLTLPAEVIHPAESRVASRGAQLPTVSGPGYDIVFIPKNGQYVCTWRLNENNKELSAVVTKWDVLKWHIFFHPGRYEIQATIHLWSEKPNVRELVASHLLESGVHNQEDLAKLFGALASLSKNEEDKEGKQAGESGRIIQDEDINESVSGETEDAEQERLLDAKDQQFDVLAKSIPLSVVGTIYVTIKSTSQFIAAAFGGMLAFLFREFYAMTEPSVELALSDFAFFPTYVLSAILISLFVNRITEAKFPLTVKVMDFWGATAFGVLAAFGGEAVLDSIFKFIT